MHIFVKRLTTYSLFAALLTLTSLVFGILGYYLFAGLHPVDALLNASMILGGMGPVNVITNVPGKIFASFYALFSGLVFIAVIGMIFSPIIHRMLHKFHVDEKDFSK